MEYSEIEFLAKNKAKEIANVKNLKVKFSTRMKKCHALCYWNDDPKAIYFSIPFIELNKDNDTVLWELVIHECIHLIPGCDTHNKKFIKNCEKYGIRLYGYSVPRKDVKPRFSTYCSNCNRIKSFYVKPRNFICKDCGGKLDVYDSEK